MSPGFPGGQGGGGKIKKVPEGCSTPVDDRWVGSTGCVWKTGALYAAVLLHSYSTAQLVLPLRAHAAAPNPTPPTLAAPLT